MQPTSAIYAIMAATLTLAPGALARPPSISQQCCCCGDLSTPAVCKPTMPPGGCLCPEVVCPPTS